MMILVLGSGGREHALCRALDNGKHTIYCAPGNAGTEAEFYNLALNPINFEALAANCKSLEIDLVIVGPETMLEAGVVDHLTKAGITVFGPTKAAAEVESKKPFMKDICQQEQIPTAQMIGLDAWGFDFPWVVKENGLAGGKGVYIVHSDDEYRLIRDKLKDEKKQFFVEKFLPGRELSYHVLCDGLNYVVLPVSRDYKQLYPGGPMTGGMGAISRNNLISAKTENQIKTQIVAPFIKGMIWRNLDYRGVLYFGLMIAEDGSPSLLEVNCRFGDPEAQAILPRMVVDCGLAELLMKTIHGELNGLCIGCSRFGSAVVNVVTGEYPHPSPLPYRMITGAERYNLVHCNTIRATHGGLLTGGGRIFSAMFHGENAVSEAYEIASKVEFEGATFRHDIGS